MAFIGGVFKSIGNAVKSFATSGIGRTLIGSIAGVIGGPIGKIAADAALNLLSGKKLSSVFLNAAKSAFGGVAGKLAGGLIDKLPAALKAPLGNIAGSLLKGEKLSLSKIAGDLLKNTKLGGTISKALDTAKNILGTGTRVAGSAQGVLKSISDLLGKFGVNTSGLGNASNIISKVLGAFDGINGVINKASNIFNPQTNGMPLMRA